MDWTWGWSAVGALATCILAGGIFFAIRQFRQAKLSTNAQIAVELFCELRSEKVVEILRFIYSLNREEDMQNLPSVDRNNIGYVLGRYEILGALVGKGIIDRKLAMETYGGHPVIRCWYQLCKQYIRKEQNRRGYFHDNYEIFARQCLEHFSHEHIRVGLGNKYYKKENLVVELKNELKEFRPRSLGEIKKDRRA